MQIPAEYLKEVNYQGTRLVPVNDEKLDALQVELDAHQAEARPFLEEMETLAPEMDVVYSEIQTLRDREVELRKKIAPTRAKHDALEEKVKEIDLRAVPIKDKMATIVTDLVEGDLGEFEIPLHTVYKEGKIYVEIRDELEEKIKQVREMKARVKAKNAASK